MTINWPSWLPDGTIEGYSYSRKDIVLRTELETGRVRSRRRYSDGPALVNIAWALEGSAFAYFEGWFLNTLQAGALPFTITLDVGKGCVAHECRFVSPYVMQRLDRPDLYRVSAVLEAKQLSVWDSATLADIDAVIAQYIAEGFSAGTYWDFLDLFEIYVNIDLPHSAMRSFIPAPIPTPTYKRMWGPGIDDIRTWSSDPDDVRIWKA